MRARAFAAFVLLAAAPTQAVEPTDSEVEIAREYFAQAQELGEKGAWVQAAEKLQSALELKETPGLRFHLAHALEQQGQLLEARAEYDRSAQLIEDGVTAPDVAALLVDARRQVRERIPTLRVVVDPPAAGALVVIDDGAPTAERQTVPMNPGKHVVVVTAPGHERFEASMELEEGDRRVIHAALPELPARSSATARDVSPPPVATGMGARGAVLTAEGVLTLAAVGLGIYFKVQEGDAEDSAERWRNVVDADPNSGPNGCEMPEDGLLQTNCGKLADAARNETRARNAAIGSFVGAGIGAAGFLATLVLWSPQRPDQTARVTVQVESGRVFSTVSGHF